LGCYHQAKQLRLRRIQLTFSVIFAENILFYGKLHLFLPHIMRGKNIYIHEKDNWTNFTWNEKIISKKLAETRNLQGRLLGKMESLGFDLQDEAALNTLTLEIVKSSEIEGEILDLEQVRSSIARHLGIELAGAIESERHIDGIVEMMLNATQKYDSPLTKERLFGWHSALFPTGWSNLYRIVVANWRKDTTGPMQVVSGAMGKEKIHFEAPNSDRIELEIEKFINWIELENEIDPVLKAAIVHLWFITIHPFEDGNGRITRAITEMFLARSDNSAKRFYSMSSQIKTERKQYYEILEKTQKGTLDITNWIEWFLECLKNSFEPSSKVLSRTLIKADFWKTHSTTILNQRQHKMLNKLLDGFDGKLTTSKWGKICKCSQDTALRDIQDLMTKKILRKESSGGRSTNYELIEKPDGNTVYSK
tara:strand:- start:44 stop:1306 length:1263 start_codon:yes stop_codon:yes gene_type:complete